MLSMTKVFTFSTALLVATSVFGNDQTTPPKAVQDALKDMQEMCVTAGGKPAKSPGLLTDADLNGDSIPDFIIDESAFICDGALSLFSGSGGSMAVVYIGTPKGQTTKSIVQQNLGIKVNKESKPATLMLMVAGSLCGQEVTPATPHSEMQLCWRPVMWNEENHKLEFAPVSQIQPVQN